MPNHVSNRVTFSADKAEEVFAAVCPDGHFDFSKLVPTPPNMYHGDLSSTDEADFPCNWMAWSRQNWGTKWNAYDTSCGIEDGVAFIKFDTAWKPPFPVMAAFCNRFNIPFEHRYFDEAPNFWGIDTWALPKRPSGATCISRIEKRFKVEEDRKPLGRQLAGVDWESLEAELAAESASPSTGEPK